MAKLVHIRNVPAIHVGLCVVECEDGLTIGELLDRGDWNLPARTVLVRNGELVKRVDWDLIPLARNEVATFVTLPGNGGGKGSQILAIVAQIALMIAAFYLFGPAGALTTEFALSATEAAIASVAFVVAGQLLISAFMPKPKPVKSPDLSQSPSYSLQGQANLARLGQMVPEQFGRFEHVVDLGAAPWTRYVNGNQELNELFCLGYGYFDIEQVNIGDTAVWKDGDYTGAFPEVLLQFCDPGESMNLFEDNVVTATDVDGTPLLGTNEDGYAWSGPFVLCKPGQKANQLDIDILCPAGLFHVTSGGGIASATVEFEFQMQGIDNAGNAVGGWTTVISETLTLASKDAVRLTYTYDIPAVGRYQVRGHRTNTKSTDSNTADQLLWGEMRGHLPSKGVYDHVTMMGLQATSSANLNSQNQRQITVVKTRKVQLYNADTGLWDATHTATRSPAWALGSMLRSGNGGNLADNRIDGDKLAELDATWAARGDYCDGIFDSQQSLLEAAQAVVQVGRGRVVLVGSTVSVVRDEPRTVPRCMFSARDMLPKTFQVTYAMHDVNAVDALAVTYWDSRIWAQHQVLCKFDDSEATLESATPIQMFGITSYNHAWREGIYMVAANRYRRRVVDFQTELTGRVCRFGDLVLIGNPIPKWGLSADVVALEEHDDGDIVTLSEPYIPPDGDDGEAPLYIQIGTPDGQVYGPVSGAIVAQETTDPRTTLVKLTSTAEVTIGKYAGDQPRDWPVWSGDGLQKQRPKALLGQGTQAAREALITRMTPQQDLQTAVTAALDDPRVYTADTGTPPDDPYPIDDGFDADLLITDVEVTESGSDPVSLDITVSGASDALGFYVSYRNLPSGAWSGATKIPGVPVGGVTHLPFSVPAGKTQIAVWAYDLNESGRKANFFFVADGVDDSLPADVSSVTTDTHWSSGNIGAWSWPNAADAARWVLRVEARQSDADPWIQVRFPSSITNSYTYYPANEIADGGPFNHLRIGVLAQNGAGNGTVYTNSSEDP